MDPARFFPAPASLTNLPIVGPYEASYGEIHESAAELSLEYLATALQSTQKTLKAFLFLIDNSLISHGSSMAAFSALETLDIQLSVLPELGLLKNKVDDRLLDEVLPLGLKDLKIRCHTTKTEHYLLRPRSRMLFKVVNSVPGVVKCPEGYLSQDFRETSSHYEKKPCTFRIGFKRCLALQAQDSLGSSRLTQGDQFTRSQARYASRRQLEKERTSSLLKALELETLI